MPETFSSLYYISADNDAIIATRSDGSARFIDAADPIWQDVLNGDYGVISAYQAPPAPTAAETRAAQIGAIRKERDRRLAADFTFNGVAYQRDPVSLQRITGAATLAGFAIAAGAQPGNFRWANPNRDFAWIASDNVARTMDAQTAFDFGKAAAEVETTIVFAAAALREMEPIPDDITNDSWWLPPSSED